MFNFEIANISYHWRWTLLLFSKLTFSLFSEWCVLEGLFVWEDHQKKYAKRQTVRFENWISDSFLAEFKDLNLFKFQPR